MTTSLELRSVAAFSDLPDDQIEWFLSHVHGVSVQAGETFVRRGDPADWLVIFLEA
jgi:CRP-like cAMP-binding protein